MPIIGNLIKGAIELSQLLLPNGANPQQLQEKQLRQLLEKAKLTSFGIYYGFDELLEAENMVEAFQKRVPIYNYDEIHKRWWNQQQTLPNITWPGKPDYFALSSGTTGKASKRIPVTNDMLASFRAVGISQVASLSNYDLPADFFERDILMLGSSADLNEHNGHLEGEISGINTSNLPGWFDNFYKPGLQLAKIDDWDERIAAISKVAPEWDVGAIAGIPSWVQLMLERIIENHQLETIRDLWPNLKIYASGGVAFAPYRERFDELTGGNMIYQDTYLASEGFIAYTARPNTMEMTLAINHHIFFEFIPFDKRGFDETGQLLDDPLVLSIDQVEEDQDYALLISTPAGAWRYMIGDTIKFTNIEALEMHISGRTKYWLNVVGSQLSEEKLNRAIQELSEKLDITIQEFAVACLQDESGCYYHQWVLGTNDNDTPPELDHKLDEILKHLNKNYKVARSKALKYIKVTMVNKEKLYEWLESRKKKGGQIKFPKVMKAEMMEDLLEFL